MTTCVICHGPDATPTKKALNGLPKTVVACDDCRAAVTRREVGVVVRDNGSLHITDGRPPRLTAVISGGQTGSDMGALLAARELGIETGGYAPKGWMTERGPNPKQLKELGLIEWMMPGYPARTKANVQVADGTLIIGKVSPGSRLTADCCEALGKPSLWVGDVRVFIDQVRADNIVWVQDWLKKHRVQVLNCAGNRESVSPGIEEAAREFVVEVLS